MLEEAPIVQAEFDGRNPYCLLCIACCVRGSDNGVTLLWPSRSLRYYPLISKSSVHIYGIITVTVTTISSLFANNEIAVCIFRKRLKTVHIIKIKRTILIVSTFPIIFTKFGYVSF